MSVLWKAFVSIVKWGLLSVALLMLLFVVINWRDEALKKEVVVALSSPLPADSQQDNGYWTLLGIDAPTEQDAYQVGKAAFNKELGRFKQMQATHQEPPIKEMSGPSSVPKNIDALKCKYRTSQNCVETYLNQDPHLLAEAVDSYQLQLRRLEAIKRSQYYVELMLPMVSAEVPRYSVLMNAVELQRMQAILAIKNKQVSQGMAQLIANAQLSRRLLNASNSLISHMIALSMMQRDIQLLSELLAKYPGLAADYHAQIQPLLASIDTPAYSLKSAFVSERHMMITTMNNLTYATPGELFSTNEGVATSKMPANVTNAVLARFYQGNATTNLMYDLNTQAIVLAEASPPALDGLVKQIEQTRATYFGVCFVSNTYCFKNPVGKILANIAQLNGLSYIQRHHDMEGYIRLVRIQWQVAAEHTLAERIPAVLAQHPNPYTLQPMHYNSQQGTLSFEGRYQRYGEPASHLYKVSLAATLP